MVWEAAERLKLTRMSVTRAAAQLEGMGLISQEKSGKEIYMQRNCPRREYFEKAEKYLIHPVQRVMEAKKTEIIQEMLFAGEGALNRNSSLNPPRIAEYAVYKGAEIVGQLIPADSRIRKRPNVLKFSFGNTIRKYTKILKRKNIYVSLKNSSGNIVGACFPEEFLFLPVPLFDDRDWLIIFSVRT